MRLSALLPVLCIVGAVPLAGQAAPCAPGCQVAIPPGLTIADSVPTAPADPADTTRRRTRSVEVDDWYYRRLTLHRWVSYATIPVFAAQWAAGSVIFPDPRNAPRWAKDTHDAGADLLLGMFTVNTVTGVWNWWDSRTQPKGLALSR